MERSAPGLPSGPTGFPPDHDGVFFVSDCAGPLTDRKYVRRGRVVSQRSTFACEDRKAEGLEGWRSKSSMPKLSQYGDVKI